MTTVLRSGSHIITVNLAGNVAGLRFSVLLTPCPHLFHSVNKKPPFAICLPRGYTCHTSGHQLRAITSIVVLQSISDQCSVLCSPTSCFTHYLFITLRDNTFYELRGTLEVRARSFIIFKHTFLLVGQTRIIFGSSWRPINSHYIGIHPHSATRKLRSLSFLQPISLGSRSFGAAATSLDLVCSRDFSEYRQCPLDVHLCIISVIGLGS